MRDLEEWESQDEIIYKHKFHVDWVQEGDRSSYFFCNVCFRMEGKEISLLLLGLLTEINSILS